MLAKLITLAAAALALLAPAAAQTDRSNAFAAGVVLVMPHVGSERAAEAIAASHGATMSRRITPDGLRLMHVPRGREAAIVAALSLSGHVRFAEVDRLVAPDLVTNDPYLGAQWHLGTIGAGAAWDIAQGSGVTIAVCDTGVDASHPDLAARMVPGWNVYGGNADTADVHGHGTKVAGAAAAAFDNAIGVAGVAGRALIMPVRISDAAGMASYSAMAQCITWAADRGARVANVSYMGTASYSVQNAGAYMKGKGGLVTVSAGNSGGDPGIAASTSLVTVSATTSADVRPSWSSYGAHVTIAAPGEGIYTTTAGGGYGAPSGTSFSAPVVAGVVALMMSAQPALTASDVERLLLSTAVDLGDAGRDPFYGAGRVDAAAAVAAARVAVPTTGGGGTGGGKGGGKKGRGR